MPWAAAPPSDGACANTSSDDGDESESESLPVMSLAVLGTMSDAGKSTITAGLCRILTNGGMRVAPFKAQNMSNNATPALLPDPSRRAKLYHSFQKVIGNKSKAIHDDQKGVDQGYGEIGTAQALQAEACKIVPRVEMNPVLLKSGGRRKKDGAFLCSVVVLGKQVACETYGDLGKRTTSLKSMVIEAHAALVEATGAQVTILEGAGSCTELNLMSRDIVNLPLVRALACPWILVANIDCGGVFAQIVGTKMCVSERDWSMCVGVVVNKLRGEAKYFEPGPRMLQNMIGKPIFVVPHLNDLNLPEEDGLGIERRLKKEYDDTKEVHFEQEGRPRKPVVVVVAYPHIAIADDLCPLENDSRFEVQWRRRNIPKPYPHTSAIILPGSRLTRLDLKWLHDSGWYRFILKHYSKGGAILGLCGGYQMLGRTVEDPSGAEGNAGSKKGLALLPVETVIAPAECKIVTPRKATLLSSGIEVEGFELHCGRSTVVADYQLGYNGRLEPLLLYEDGTKEGLSAGRVNGTYLHGILRSPGAREKLLLGEGEKLPPSARVVEDPLDRLANHLISCGLDFETVMKMASTKPQGSQSTSGADSEKKDLETNFYEKSPSALGRCSEKSRESEISHDSQRSNQSEDNPADASRRSERSQSTEHSRTERSRRSQDSGTLSQRRRAFDENELNGDVDSENTSAKRNTESSPVARHNSQRSFQSEKSRRSEKGKSEHSRGSETRSFNDEVLDGDADFQSTSTKSNTEKSPSSAKHSSQRSFLSGKSGRSEKGKSEHSHRSETRSFNDEVLDGEADFQNTSATLKTEISPAATKQNSQRSFVSERSRRSQKSQSDHSRHSHDSDPGRSGISESSRSFDEVSFDDEPMDGDTDFQNTSSHDSDPGRSGISESSRSFDEISFDDEGSFDDEPMDGDADFQNTSTKLKTEISPAATKQNSQRSFVSERSRSQDSPAGTERSQSFNDEVLDGDADFQSTSATLKTEMSPAAATQNSQRSSPSERSRRSQKSQSDHSRRSHDSPTGRSGISAPSRSFDEQELSGDADLESISEQRYPETSPAPEQQSQRSFVSEKSRRSEKSQPEHSRRSETSRHSQDSPAVMSPTGGSRNSEVSRSFDDGERDEEDASETRQSERSRSVNSRSERSRITKTDQEQQSQRSFVSEKSRRSEKSQPEHSRRSETSRHSQDSPAGTSPTGGSRNSEVSRSFDDGERDEEDASEMRHSERSRSVKSSSERSRITKTDQEQQSQRSFVSEKSRRSEKSQPEHSRRSETSRHSEDSPAGTSPTGGSRNSEVSRSFDDGERDEEDASETRQSERSRSMNSRSERSTPGEHFES